MTDMRCAGCKWYQQEDEELEYGWMCANKLSDFFVDRTDDDFKCEKWEALKNEP